MKAGELIILLKGARGIEGHEFMGLGRADMYAVLSIGGEERKSKVIHNVGTNPEWDEKLSFKIAEYVNFALYNSLRIRLYDDDMNSGSLRGTAKIDVENLLEAYNHQVPLQSYTVLHGGKQHGTVELALSFTPSHRMVKSR